jgi:hypothetical protein
VHDVPEVILTHDASTQENRDKLQALAARCMDKATTAVVEGNHGKMRRNRPVLIRGRTRTQRQHLRQALVTKLEVFKHHGTHELARRMQTNHGELLFRTARDDLDIRANFQSILSCIIEKTRWVIETRRLHYGIILIMETPRDLARQVLKQARQNGWMKEPETQTLLALIKFTSELLKPDLTIVAQQLMSNRARSGNLASTTRTAMRSAIVDMVCHLSESTSVTQAKLQLRISNPESTCEDLSRTGWHANGSTSTRTEAYG